ncbi:cell surface A33 antigen-like [Carassius auratus]|uniref:Cell surface A33 antigen-like n=1 Tax=Carassius auratus TaxID=7957 RepID=A0A6P6KT47_CARAU|nr:cell surface A33 antigen-like [Carassius auratus]
MLGFFVQVPTGPLFIRLGGSVLLPCYVDQPLPMKRLRVEWTRTESNNLVHLFIYGESRPEEQHQDYYDRAHFFDDYVKDGIFSLRLDNLRAEDVGFYRCKVYSQKDVGETVVHIKDVEHLNIVSGPNHPISAYVGEDVTLTCSVDSHITPEKIEEISWRKKDKDGDILVLVFQKAKPLSSDERYRDSAEFFTAEIPKGNFSLRLKSVRTEDKGVYMCYVRNGRVSANTTVTIERLSFSTLHITIIVLCIIASGSALLLWYLIYCRSQNDSIGND